MATGQALPKGAPKQPTKTEIVYRQRKIHWLIKMIGYVSTVYMGFVFLGVFTGNWLGVDKIYPEFKLIAGTLVVVAIAAQLLSWKLADSLTSGEGFE